jgi:predicted AAA+ superfamily ATPase
MSQDSIYNIKNKIQTLKWDIANISNEQILQIKKKHLKEYEDQLKKLERR